jgi:hypothetical protein
MDHTTQELREKARSSLKSAANIWSRRNDEDPRAIVGKRVVSNEAALDFYIGLINAARAGVHEAIACGERDAVQIATKISNALRPGSLPQFAACVGVDQDRAAYLLDYTIARVVKLELEASR